MTITSAPTHPATPPLDSGSAPPGLAARLSGRVITAADPDWDEVRRVFNLTVDLRPAAVVLPRTERDVVAAVRYARAHGLQVAPQATGHNAGALGGLDNTVLVDVRELRGIEIDSAARRVRVGAGVRWEDVVPSLSELGLAALHGSSPLVGVAGYSLGGGMGWLARKHGLQTNSIIAFDVATASGPLRVDAEHHADLFWALRGGNGNYGVVTALEFRVQPVRELYAGAMFFPVELARDVLGAWTATAPELPDETMTWTSLMQLPDLPDVPAPLRGRSVCVFHAAHLGDESTGARLLRRVRDLGPEIDTFAMVPPVGLKDLAMDPTEPLPFTSTTATVDSLTPGTLDELVRVVGPGSGSPLPLVQIRHLGGALSRRTPDAGARATIDGEFCFFALGVTPDAPAAAEVTRYLRRLDAVLAPHRVGAYPNFVESPSDARAFWDAATWARLCRVKSDYDPGDVFRGNHHIPPTLTGH